LFAEIKKCIGEYLTAVKSSQHSPSGKHVLPKCQSDGSYVPTQCHASIGYCWCADIDTGKPIPGTTKKTTSLDCGKYGIFISIYTPVSKRLSERTPKIDDDYYF
jgi:hypothetical protein